MALLLRFRRRVRYDAIWLDKARWNNRWRKNPDEFGQLLDANAETVLEDLGGFAQLVEQAVWWPGGEFKRCKACGLDLPVTEFRVTPKGPVRPECHRCESSIRLARKANRQAVA